MKNVSILYCLSILFFFACSSEQAKDEQQNTPETTEEVAIPEKEVLYLEGIYATSTKTPQAEFGTSALFDHNPATYWATAQGAAPDEGLMLYFKEPTFITAIETNQAQGTGIDEIKTVLLYVNGQQQEEEAAIDKKIPIGKKVSSLFIRVKQLGSLKTLENSTEYSTKKIELFSETLSAAISELVIYGKGNKKLNVQAPKRVKGTITASSTLAPEISYHTNQLFDARKEFVWVEGSETAGEGETLIFDLEEETEISALELWNGYQRSVKHYKGNTRVKSFEFGRAGGEMASYTLADKQQKQMIPLKKSLKGRQFILKITAVYPGTKYKDLAISELRFYNGKMPIVVSNNQTEYASEQLVKKNKNTILTKVLDKRFKTWESEEIYTTDKSIILRSDYTFVIYQNDTDEESESTTEVVADGGWELVEAKATYAKVRIFGKIRNLSESVDFYKGETSNNYLRIFQDYLHIRKESIKADKFFDEFPLNFPDSAFVDVGAISKDFVLDMKYATTDNFIGEKVYECGRCLMRYEAAMALLAANENFKEQGYRIKFFDCYRPLSIQKVMWDKYPNPSYVANPYKGIGSIHNRGGAVDMTLVDGNGKELDMGTPFDFFGKEAHQDNMNLPEPVLKNRKLLREGMEAVGFRHIRTEWWHYSFHNKAKFTVADAPIKCS